MEKMIVVVFDEEKKANEAAKDLTRLDAADDITVYAEAVIEKNADGTVSIEESTNVFPAGTITGTAIGALIGLLGLAPVAGAAGGAVAGSMLDLDRAGVNEGFLNEVSGKLKPGMWALVSDISEESMTAVDSQMRVLGSTVFRVPWQNVKDEEYRKEVASMQTEIDQLDKEEEAETKAEAKQLKKEERAESRTQKKAEIHVKMESLRDRLHNKLEEWKLRSEERKKESEAKIKYLKQKAANARGNAKSRLEARESEIRNRDQKSSPSTQAAVQKSAPSSQAQVQNA